MFRRNSVFFVPVVVTVVAVALAVMLVGAVTASAIAVRTAQGAEDQADAAVDRADRPASAPMIPVMRSGWVSETAPTDGWDAGCDGKIALLGDLEFPDGYRNDAGTESRLFACVDDADLADELPDDAVAVMAPGGGYAVVTRYA